MENDMAILLVYFNPCRRKRILMNHLYTENKFRSEGLPVFTIEILLNGNNADIHNSIRVRSNSYMFFKEHVYRILEKKIPSKYTKLAFLDNDVYYKDTNWYYRSSQTLNDYDVVQPFEYAVWQDITYKKPTRLRVSIVKYGRHEFYSTIHDKYHVGFAWCMRRDWYNKLGFFDYAILGGGDTLSSFGWLGIEVPLTNNLQHRWFRQEYAEFIKTRPNITFLGGETINHLFHGSLKRRNYYNRHLIIDSTIDKKEDIIYTNEDGVFEWLDKDKYNPLVLEYLMNRNDDSID